MNVSKDKIIIDAFVNRSDVGHHEKAVQLLFYGRPSAGTYIENDYVKSIKKAVRICFSDVKYRGRFQDVYDTFVSLFYAYLLTKSEPLLKIETTLAGYLFITAKNFANNKRKEIDTLIGLSDISSQSEYTSTLDGLLSKENEADETQTNDLLIDESESGATPWTEYLINKYIDAIPTESYRVALRAIVLEGMSREDFAEESGTTYAAVNLLVSHAMTALTNVALPDIRWRSKKCYTQYGHLIKSQKDKAILRDYFETNIYSQGLPVAVRRLIKISIQEMKEQAVEERRESRRAAK